MEKPSELPSWQEEGSYTAALDVAPRSIRSSYGVMLPPGGTLLVSLGGAFVVGVLVLELADEGGVFGVVPGEVPVCVGGVVESP
jgi:hypothetical protein